MMYETFDEYIDHIKKVSNNENSSAYSTGSGLSILYTAFIEIHMKKELADYIVSTFTTA